MDSVIKALKFCGPKLMGLPNVVGVGRGHKHVRGQNTGRALWWFWSTKVPKEELKNSHMIPKSLNECLTDVIEIGECSS